MKTETRQYKDVSGNPCTLDWLVNNEPEWAANQIRHRDKLETELAAARAALETIARYDEESIWDDDRDDAANAMLYVAREALGEKS
jgi:hypothetical protein